MSKTTLRPGLKLPFSQEVTLKIDGACHCGNITFEAEVDPEKVLICHCTDCGTPIYAGPVEGDSGMLGIRVGAIKQREQLTPRTQYYCVSAQHWVQDLSSVSRAG